jgi:hypothetical protein
VGLDLRLDGQVSAAGLPDGNYPHNTDPAKFHTTTAQEYAYERNCRAGMKYDPYNDVSADPASVPEESLYAYCVENGLVNDQRT